MAGSMLAGAGACATAAAFGWRVPHGLINMNESPLPAALLVAGSGLAINIAAWERWSNRKQIATALQEVSRANAQRDLALLQARRMRAQAEGLALMREIHRSTSIPARHDRLHRILTLLADLFEAKEVSLFAVSADGWKPPAFRIESRRSDPAGAVLPAACLRITNKEEIFVTFDTECIAQQPESILATAHSDRIAKIAVARKSATIVREGCQLFVDGVLELGNMPVAKAQWRRGANADHDVLTTQDPAEILEGAIAKLDYGPAARVMAAKSLDCCRTVRDSGVLCVPLLADQRSVGVLRIRRMVDDFGSPESEALEEMLLESAKHIALALKKDEDDRAAITDALTSLYIKKHFLATLEQLRAEAAAEGSSKNFCLVLCDIDHFKRVNDTHGHLSGDLILKGVAAVLRKALRTGDIAFRYGGEEMAVLLPSSSLEAAEQTAARLRISVQDAIFKGEKGQVVPVTISLGISQYQAGLTGDSLISRADRALYASKEGGRNRATSWSPGLPDPLEKKKKEPVKVPSSNTAPVQAT